MAYSTISQSELNPDSPVVDTVFSRMRDNWIAIKDGESGAPRIETEAIQRPTAGNNWAWTANALGASASWSAFGGVGSGVGPEYYTWQAWRTGRMRFWLTFSRTITSSVASMRVYRNGTAYSSIYTCPAGQTSASHVFDLAFNAGDTIQIWRQCSTICEFAAFAGMIAYPFAYIG